MSRNRAARPAVKHSISLPHDLSEHYMALVAESGNGHGSKSAIVQEALTAYIIAHRLCQRKGNNGRVSRVIARGVRLYLSRDGGG